PRPAREGYELPFSVSCSVIVVERGRQLDEGGGPLVEQTGPARDSLHRAGSGDPVPARCGRERPYLRFSTKKDSSLSNGIRSVRSYRSMWRAPGTTTSSLQPFVCAWTVSLKYRECARSPVTSRMRRGAMSSRWSSAPA